MYKVGFDLWGGDGFIDRGGEHFLLKTAEKPAGGGGGLHKQNRPEARACISARGEERKGGHGVPDPGFAFQSHYRPANYNLTTHAKLEEPR